MRIALLSADYPGVRPSGVGSYTLYLAAELAAAGHEPHVFTLPLTPDARAAAPARVVIHEAPDVAAAAGSGLLSPPLAALAGGGGPALFHLSNAWLMCDALRRAHADTPFDVIETPEVLAAGLPLLLRPIAHVPVVCTLHSGTFISRRGNNLPATLEDQTLCSLELATLLLADALCAPTQAVVDLTRQFAAFSDPVHIFPSPLPAIGAPTSVQVNGPVLFVGRIEPLKGCAMLAPALNIFLQRCPEARVQMIGPDTPSAPGGGSMRRWLEDALNPSIRSRVDFTGSLPAAQVKKALECCSFMIVPSVYENFSTVAAEAMAAGRAVIYSSDTGVTETVGCAGIAVSSHEPAAWAAALEALWRDPARQQTLGAQAAARARTYLSVENTIKPRIAFYQQACAARAAADRTTTHIPPFEKLAALAPAYAAPLVESLSLLVGQCLQAPSALPLTPGRRLTAVLMGLGPAGQNAWLYGAGQHTTRLLAERHYWDSHGMRITGLIDDHPRFKNGGTFADLPVQPRAWLEERCAAAAPPCAALVLSTDTLEDLFWENSKRLQALGLPVRRLYDAAPETASCASR